MQCEDKVETEHSLAKVHKVCRLIGIIVKIIFVVFCVCWLSTVLLMIYSLINPSELGAAEGVSVPRIALYFVHGFAVALIFVVFIGIFVDAVKGQSPFVMKQVKRLRLIAGLLAIYAIVDDVISGHIGLVQYAGLNSGYVSTGGNEIIPINLAPIIGASVAFAFSFVFQYGVLLQELSDDTI